MNHKAFPFEVKDVDSAQGKFTGHAATFDNEDLGGDVVSRGAFSKTLKENGNRGFKVYYNHGKGGEPPVGITTTAKADDQGLYVEGQLFVQKQRLAQDLIEPLLHKAIKDMSFGYDTIKQTFKQGVRYLTELKLYEVSLVDWPMNPSSQVLSVKSLGTENKYTDFALTLEQSAMYEAPFKMLQAMERAIMSIFCDPELKEDEIYQLAQDSLLQFDSHFSAFLDRAYQGGYLKEHALLKEFKDTVKSATATLMHPQAPESAPPAVPADAEVITGLNALLEELDARLHRLNKITEV